MIPSRWDRPGQSAQGSVSPTQAWFAANAARICGQPRSTSVLPFHGYRAWCTMVHQTRNLSDATPIARGNTPLTIPVLTIPAPCGNIPCVYVLEHTATFRSYTGQTNALQRRLSEHLGGRGCATTARDPKRRWRCALVVSGFEDRNAARLFEAFLKREPGLEAKIRATRRAIASEKGQRLRMELL